MQDKKLSAKQLERLELWRVFNLRQGGSMPSGLAADYLRMSNAGVYKAASKGWLSWITLGRNRFYGKKDLENYRYTISRKFPENRRTPKNESGEFKLP